MNWGNPWLSANESFARHNAQIAADNALGAARILTNNLHKQSQQQLLEQEKQLLEQEKQLLEQEKKIKELSEKLAKLEKPNE